MPALDMSLMERAEPHFCDAFATYDQGDRDLVRTAQEITMAGKMAGFTKLGRRRMLDYLYGFMDTLEERGVDPFLKGNRLDDPSTLFSRDRLGGLFNADPTPQTRAQSDLFGPVVDQQPRERALIDQLIAATKLYDSSEAIQELFAFTIRLREFAPFNAMLLHIQKPGLTHAATADDWWHRFGRVPKKGSRPLLVLRMKGPVDFVFDVQDTEGKDPPVDAFSFPTFGNLSDNRFAEFMRAVRKEKIDLVQLDAGDGQAGWIRLLAHSKSDKGKNVYQLAYNRNHPAPTRFVTVAHELAHLYLGHLGADNGRRVPDRRNTPHELMEVEAEMAAYLVAMRNGLEPRSESYLSNYKGAFEDLNLYAVTRTANAVETAMAISAQKLWNEKE
ncbi:ImmA/IrrE family metallo-endopeptidase [Aureimonas sp. SK2]|uniref:ImmA/IrrE family metallo-endopeptidase n=1 Tax=Aureimonas sp. SK2 TaxID=3015992 RepID=UPI002444B64B|nr:ImmA/IrrE family metallo-endopeptidase [Aureimonas sp. SK2]